MSHLESIFIPHSDSIVETIENSVYLFRNPLSLPCEIIRFRHYFGDPYSFQKSSNIPFRFLLFFFYTIEIVYERLIPLWYTFDRKSFTNSEKFYFFSVWFFDFFKLSIYILKIYLQSWSNLLIVTNPRFFPLINESILSTRAPSCTIYLQPNTN